MLKLSPAPLEQPLPPRACLSLLIVEDVPEDAELMVEILESSGFILTYQVVDNKTDCEQSLKEHTYDAILSDYHLPQFNGLEALKLLQASGQQIPFILVTGNLGEEAAVEFIKAGITDYVLKSRLFRLPSVLERSLQEFELRQDQQTAIAQIHHQAQQQGIINQIIRAMRDTLVLDEVLQTTADQLHQVLHVNRCIIFRPNSQQRITAHYISQETLDRQNLFNISCAFYDFYHDHLAQGQPLIFSQINVNHPPELQTAAQDCNIRSILIVPLVYKESYLGGISLHQCEQERQWTRSDITLLTTIADQCAIAIHQAELYQQAQTELAERKRAELALRESQAQLTAMAANLPGTLYRGIIRHDRLVLLYISPGVQELTGIQPQILLQTLEPLYQIIHPQDRQLYHQQWQDALHNLEPSHREYRIITPTGTVKWLRDSSQFSQKDDGEIIVDGVCLDITDRKEAENRFQQRHEELEAIFQAIPDLFFRLAADGTYLDYKTQNYGDLFTNPENFLGKLIQNVLPAPVGQQLYQGIQNALQKQNLVRLEYSLPINNIVQDYEARIVPLVNDQTIAIIRNITDRKQVESALRESEQRFRSLIENATDIIVILDEDGIFRYVSPSVQRILGYDPQTALGRNSFDLIHSDDIPLMTYTLRKALTQPGVSQPAIEYRIQHQNGFWCMLEAVATNLLEDPAVRGIVINCHDITQRKMIEQQVLHDAFHDGLTGLPNRALLIERLEQALKYIERRPNYQFAVVLIDLDRFKVINDSLGHIVGDQLLKVISERLKHSLRNGDTVARLGGDEFVLLLEGITGINDALNVTQRLQEKLASPMILEGNEVFITASMGIAVYGAGYNKPEQLLRDADTAMYRAKELGRARHEVFQASMHADALKLLQLGNDLRRAIERESFEVHYQPIISLHTGALEGFEALVRWRHSEQGLISPAEFIPVAEETGLIIPIGQWVLRQACRQVRTWQQRFQGRIPLQISVNLSVKQFSQPNLIEQIDQILYENGLDGSCLKLEITESVLIENDESVTVMLTQLRHRNIQLCIDDFGTGYSSLSYLHRFPTNLLKIDRSFVSRIGKETMPTNGIDPTEIIRSIVTLSHNLGMSVVAEGVETREQLAQLQSLNCDYGQGYLFSKAVDAEAATELVEQCLLGQARVS